MYHTAAFAEFGMEVAALAALLYLFHIFERMIFELKRHNTTAIRLLLAAKVLWWICIGANAGVVVARFLNNLA